MTVLMASSVVVVGFALVPGAHHRGHQGLVDRDGQLSRLVHQRHPTRADAIFGPGMKAAIIGTCIITLTATVIAVPLGIAGAVYLNEYGTHHARSPRCCDSWPT